MILRRKRTWIAIAFGWLVLLVWIVARVPTPSAPLPIPTPNGYDDFVQAGKDLILPPMPERKVAPPLGAEWMITNREAVQRFRLGLSRPSATPPIAVTNLQTHYEDLERLKGLGRLLAGAAEAARQEQDWDRLVTLSTEGLDFSLRLTRGGVMVDEMTARPIENLARVPLELALTNLPAAPARKAAKILHALDASRTPFSDIRLAEESFALRMGSFPQRIAWRLFLRKQAMVVYDTQQKSWDATTYATRNLAVNLAARAYTVEHGQPPASPEALVPDYLPAIPANPLTGNPLRRVYPITTALPELIPLESP